MIALIQDGVNRSKKSVEATLLRPIATLQMESNQRAEAVQLGQETIQRKMLVFIACAAQVKRDFYLYLIRTSLLTFLFSR